MPEKGDTTTSNDGFFAYTWKLDAVTNFTGYHAQTFEDAVSFCYEPIGDLFVFIHIGNPGFWTANAGLDAPYILDSIEPATGAASSYINPEEFPVNAVPGQQFLPTRYYEVTESVALALRYPDGEGGYFEDCATADFDAVRNVRNECWTCTKVSGETGGG